MAMSEEYQLSSILYGHTSDVRTVAALPDGSFLSGSRDLSAKLWEKDMASESNFIAVQTFTGHSNFVSSVCYLPPSDKYQEGLIVTGSNDKKVRLFTPKNATPIKILSEHSNTICKVVAGNFGWRFLTASWDQTARGWREEGDDWVSSQFLGHTMAVWSVCQLLSGMVVTASADKTLRVFGESGDLQRKLVGHTDCVRDVVAVSLEEVLSVSNDASIRHWNVLSGNCLNEYYGHGHYIYSIAVLPGVGWVTSSEDRTFKVWTSNGEKESVVLPCVSVWSLAVLPNSDIVVGANDGVIRVFTKERKRFADALAQAAYREEIKKFEESLSGEVGGVKVSELPGLDALLVPGLSDGQTKLVREEGRAVAYSWSALSGTWQKIGDVVGSAGNAAGETGKPTYDGKEYDYVFNVDIEDGKPAIKLPYNKTEDPWLAAQKFIHSNNLPQTYLETVANFIITNAGQALPSVTQPEFVDPFTGSSRYVPQGKDQTRTTGPPKARHFPLKEFLRFDQGNISGIRDKLLLINKDNNFVVSEDKIESLIAKCDNKTECTAQDLATLEVLLNGPPDIVFPALDMLRLVIRKKNAAEHFCKSELLIRLEPYLQTYPSNMLAIRTCCNMMSTQVGEKLASEHRMALIEFLLSAQKPYPKLLQVAIATLLLNLAVLLNRSPGGGGRNEVLMASRELLASLEDEEAVFRGLVAIGTLLTGADDVVHYIEPIREFLVKFSSSSEMRVRDCANDLLATVQL